MWQNLASLCNKLQTTLELKKIYTQSNYCFIKMFQKNAIKPIF